MSRTVEVGHKIAAAGVFLGQSKTATGGVVEGEGSRTPSEVVGHTKVV